MSELDDGRHRRPQGEEQRLWWATLEDDALEDETRTNRRAERWLLPGAGLGLIVTGLLAWWHGGPAL